MSTNCNICGISHLISLECFPLTLIFKCKSNGLVWFGLCHYSTLAIVEDLFKKVWNMLSFFNLESWVMFWQKYKVLDANFLNLVKLGFTAWEIKFIPKLPLGNNLYYEIMLFLDCQFSTRESQWDLCILPRIDPQSSPALVISDISPELLASHDLLSTAPFWVMLCSCAALSLTSLSLCCYIETATKQKSRVNVDLL